VCELARLRGETALGFTSADGKLVLVPDTSSSPHFTRDARIVVMAEC